MKKKQNSDDPPTTSAQRKAKERNNKRSLGMVLKQIWVKPEFWPEIQAFIEKIHNRKAKNTPKKNSE